MFAPAESVLVTDRRGPSSLLQGDFQGKLKGFPALFVSDLQLSPSVQGKGLGKHLVSALQLIAMKEKMTFMSKSTNLRTANDENQAGLLLRVSCAVAVMKVFKGCDSGRGFATSLKGFALDYSFVGADEPIEIFQKCLCPADLTTEGFSLEGAAQTTPVKPKTRKKAESAVTPPSEPGGRQIAAGGGKALGQQFAAAMGQFKVLSVEERQQAVLEAFYAKVDPGAKTSAQIAEILKKRRQGNPPRVSHEAALASIQLSAFVCRLLTGPKGPSPVRVRLTSTGRTCSGSRSCAIL